MSTCVPISTTTAIYWKTYDISLQQSFLDLHLLLPISMGLGDHIVRCRRLVVALNNGCFEVTNMSDKTELNLVSVINSFHAVQLMGCVSPYFIYHNSDNTSILSAFTLPKWLSRYGDKQLFLMDSATSHVE